MLMKEAQILQELEHKDSFPKLIDASQKDDFNFIVMSFLGPNLETIKRKRNGIIS